MEQILKIMADLERSIVNDLDAICELSVNQNTNELSDNIKLNLSSALVEIRTHIQNRKRLRELAIVPENAFCKAGGKISVALCGKVTNPRSVHSKGAAAITWNIAHSLNIAVENCLSVKSKCNSEQIGLLALLNQCTEIGLNRVQVFTTDSQLHNLVENLPVYDIQDYTIQGVEIQNKFVLEKIYNIIKTTNISLSFSYPPIEQAMLSDYQSLMNLAKQEAKKRMLAQ